MSDVLKSRPQPKHGNIPDTRVTCSNCEGRGRVNAIMSIPDNEEDGTNNCSVCRGLGFTGHYAATHTTFPSEKDWREYADQLESCIAELERQLAEEKERRIKAHIKLNSQRMTVTDQMTYDLVLHEVKRSREKLMTDETFAQRIIETIKNG